MINRSDPDNKPRLEDIAKQIGVHRSTVSLALRDHPRISKRVRLKVQTLARKMGYRVNPLVAALMQSRRSGRKVKDVVLAYITCYPTRYGWRPPFHNRPDYYPGAANRAVELGYRLEHFWLTEPGMTPERMSDILTVRGIHGVMIGRLPPGKQDVSLLWDRFSSVALGLTLQTPNLHRVAEDHFSSSGKAMQQLHARGYRRIGFVFSEADDSPRVGDQWLGAFLGQLSKLKLDGVNEPLFYEAKAKHFERFGAWMKKHQPDALLVTHTDPVREWLKMMKLSVPKDIGLATVVNNQPENGCAGIYCSAEKLGALATEMLVGLMHRGEVGISQSPHEVLLNGDWLDGNTLISNTLTHGALKGTTM